MGKGLSLPPLFEAIFKYMIPGGTLVLRDKKARRIALIYTYRLNPERLIAMVFKNEKVFAVAQQMTHTKQRMRPSYEPCPICISLALAFNWQMYRHAFNRRVGAEVCTA